MPWADSIARVVQSAVVLGCVLCVCVPAQNSAAGKYDEDAYEIYSLLVSGDQAYRFANGTLVIQQETVTSEKLDDSCLTPQAAREFRDAIEDYRRHNERLLLQRNFNIDKPYELVNTETIGTLIKDCNWDDFYKRYPDSGGIFMMSAVGFNRQRTLAIVYTWRNVKLACNNHCSAGSCPVPAGAAENFHFLKKTNGKWKLVPAYIAIHCFVVS